jgi:hypothetical protein
MLCPWCDVLSQPNALKLMTLISTNQVCRRDVFFGGKSAPSATLTSISATGL